VQLRLTNAKLVCIAAIIVLVLGAMTGLIMRYVRDEPPPNDADLLVRVLPASNEDSVLMCFKLALDSSCEPSTDTEAKEEVAMLFDGPWNDELANRIITRNEKAFQHLEQVVRFDGPARPLGYQYGMLHFSGFRTVKKLQALALKRQGKEQEAFDEFIKVLACCRAVEGRYTPQAWYLSSSALRTSVLAYMRDAVADTSLSPDELKSYSGMLPKYAPTPEGLADALRMGYTGLAKWLDDTASGRPTTVGAGLLPEAGYSFHLNRTKGLFAEGYRATISQTSKKTWQQVVLPARPAKRKFPGVAGIIIHPPNYKGEAFFLRNPAGESFLKNFFEELASINATRIILALKAYQIEKGRLPGTLQELVPDYLDAVPEDPFDGQPMRYIWGKSRVYSVGLDLIDSGGDDTNVNDVVFEIGF